MKASSVLSVAALLGFVAATPLVARQAASTTEVPAATTSTVVIESNPMDDIMDALAALPSLAPITAPVGAVAVASTPYDPEAAAAAAVADLVEDIEPDSGLRKRGSCKAQSLGNYPTVSPDTDTAFLASADFASKASAATAPPGYFPVSGWSNLYQSGQKASYDTYISSPLSSYSPAQCAVFCNNRPGCVSFNIFFERDSSIFVDSTNCPTAPSYTRIKCTFFKTPLVIADAKNFGEGGTNGRFHTVIAGSNAYSTAPQPIPGFTGPVDIGETSIEAPRGETANYMGVLVQPSNVAYDPSVCAALCLEKTAFNLRHPANGVSRKCVFFDAFIATLTGSQGVFTCTFYTKGYGLPEATNQGQTRSDGFHGFTHSYIYTLDGY